MKTVEWPKKVFFYLLQCCLFNSYVTLSKNNPNSCKSFLDFMSDITEKLIHTSHAVSSTSSSSDKLQGSSRTPIPNPIKRAPKNDPPGRLEGKLKNHKLVHIPPTKNDKKPTWKCRVCVCEKISGKKLDFSVHSVVFLCIQKAATHDITCWNITKVCSKFQVFISYSFRVIIFFTEIMKEGAVDP